MPDSGRPGSSRPVGSPSQCTLTTWPVYDGVHAFKMLLYVRFICCLRDKYSLCVATCSNPRCGVAQRGGSNQDRSQRGGLRLGISALSERRLGPLGVEVRAGRPFRRSCGLPLQRGQVYAQSQLSCARSPTSTCVIPAGSRLGRLKDDADIPSLSHKEIYRHAAHHLAESCPARAHKTPVRCRR